MIKMESIIHFAKSSFTVTALKQKSKWLVLALLVILLDQVTKSVAVGALELSEPHPFLPYFNFTLLYNYGAAFSFLSDAGGWQRWFLGIVALVISILLVFWILHLDRSKTLEITGFSMILGGAIGNLWDRIFLGYVVDFIDWFYLNADTCLAFFYFRPELQSCHWPAFNIADSAIFIGVGLLLMDMFINSRN